MEELRNLALQLGKMGLLKVTLESDLNEFIKLRESIREDYNKSTHRFTAMFAESTDKLEFFVQIYGVKMLIACHNVKFEE